jgi:hypothetical protein
VFEKPGDGIPAELGIDLTQREGGRIDRREELVQRLLETATDEPLGISELPAVYVISHTHTGRPGPQATIGTGRCAGIFRRPRARRHVAVNPLFCEHRRRRNDGYLQDFRWAGQDSSLRLED